MATDRRILGGLGGGELREIATRWSLVKRYRDGDARDAALAADELAGIYLVPLYSWLRGRGYAQDDARDLLQDFMLQLFGREKLKRADPGAGRLRGFLLTSLKNFCIDRHRERVSQRRGGAACHLPIDWMTLEDHYAATVAGGDPDGAYDRGWAKTLVDMAFAELRGHYERTGQSEVFARLVPVLEGEMPAGRYEEFAAELGASAPALRVAAFRLKRRFGLEVRAAASRVFGIPEGQELDEELRAVFRG